MELEREEEERSVGKLLLLLLLLLLLGDKKWLDPRAVVRQPEEAPRAVSWLL